MRAKVRHALTVAIMALLGGCAVSPVPQADKPDQSHLEQAQEFRDQDLLDSALASFELALEDNPNLTAAHMGIGHIYREQIDYPAAHDAYQQAAARDSNHFDAFYYLGLMRQLLGKLDGAVVAYRRALEIDPASGAANRDLASTYLLKGQADLALPYAEQATVHDPQSQAAWCNLATTYSLLGQYQQTVDAYRQAAELSELSDRVLPGLAEAHLKLTHYQRAANVLEVLTARLPSTAAFERLGYAQFKMHAFEQALASYTSAQELDPNNIAALNGIGACRLTMYIQGGRKNLTWRDQAFGAWRQSLRINADQPRIVDLLARYKHL